MSSVNADSVREEFNASSDKVRIVALLSPTGPGCRSGHGVVGEVLKKFSSPKLDRARGDRRDILEEMARLMDILPLLAVSAVSKRAGRVWSAGTGRVESKPHSRP